MKLRSMAERFRRSLFYVPTMFVLAAVALALGVLELDRVIFERGYDVPDIVGSSVDSARALLGTIAGATITFAGVAFSVSLLTIQLVSSQFSPRVVRGFFRDRFSKRVMGLSLGTFTFCLLVLRGVREPNEGGSAVIPNVSVLIALLLGVGTVLAIIGFINHSAQSMEVGEIIRRISDEARLNIRRACPRDAGTSQAVKFEGGERPSGPGFVVRALSDGWVQAVDTKRLLALVPADGIVRLETAMGSFVTQGAPLATIWPTPVGEDAPKRAVRAAVHIGRQRSSDADLSFGIRQIVDIALRALSPGINDPTTAREAIAHIGAVLRELLTRDLPSRVVADDDGRRLFLKEARTHRDYVSLAFDEIRLSGANQPRVCESMLETQSLLVEQLLDRGLTERAGLVSRQAALVVEACGASGLPHVERDSIRALAEDLQLVPKVASDIEGG